MKTNRIVAISGGLLLAALTVPGCRQATPAEVGAQSIRDAQPMAVIQASQRAGAGSFRVDVPEAAKGGAVQMAPSRIR